MTIGIWQIALILIFILVWFGFGYLGIYTCNKFDILKRYIKKNHFIIICLFYLVLTSLITGKNIAHAVGMLIFISIITAINSLFRNKFAFKKILDEKFFQFLFGLIIFSTAVNILNLIPG